MGKKGTPAAKRAAVARRRAKAIDLATAGVQALAIGQQLHYGRWRTEPDDTAPDGVRYVEQVSSDKSVAQLVRQDIRRGLEDRRSDLDESVTEHRRLGNERYERLLAAAMPKALQGSIGHLRECRELATAIVKLNGAQAPQRHELSLPEATDEIKAAVAELLALPGVNGVNTSEADGAPLTAVGGG